MSVDDSLPHARGRATNVPATVGTSGGSLRSLLYALMALLSVPVHAASIPQQEYTKALASSIDRGRGQQLFQACAACHGVAGGGSRPTAWYPRLRLSTFAYW